MYLSNGLKFRSTVFIGVHECDRQIDRAMITSAATGGMSPNNVVCAKNIIMNTKKERAYRPKQVLSQHLYQQIRNDVICSSDNQYSAITPSLLEQKKQYCGTVQKHNNRTKLTSDYNKRKKRNLFSRIWKTLSNRPRSCLLYTSPSPRD